MNKQKINQICWKLKTTVRELKLELVEFNQYISMSDG